MPPTPAACCCVICVPNWILPTGTAPPLDAAAMLPFDRYWNALQMMKPCTPSAFSGLSTWQAAAAERGKNRNPTKRFRFLYYVFTREKSFTISVSEHLVQLSLNVRTPPLKVTLLSRWDRVAHVGSPQRIAGLNIIVHRIIMPQTKTVKSSAPLFVELVAAAQSWSCKSLHSVRRNRSSHLRNKYL